jgi:hypothetical protein
MLAGCLRAALARCSVARAGLCFIQHEIETDYLGRLHNFIQVAINGVFHRRSRFFECRLGVSMPSPSAAAVCGGCIAPSIVFAHFEDNFTHAYSSGGWFGVASRPEPRPGGEKVEVGLIIDNEITFEPGVTYSLKEHGRRVVTHRAAKEIPMRTTGRSCTP